MKPNAAKSCPTCAERYDADVLFCPRDGTPLSSARNPSFSGERDPYIDVELPGQIRVKHLIGIGSMGRVYRAFQGGIERDVAVKILHRELSGNDELVKRFHREAKVASRLVHPNVVQVLMTGNLPHAGDPRAGGELYLVMEYLDGISLLSALAAAGTGGEGNALPLPRALHIALQVCDAVGEAHAQSIVHRDLKPENVMLVRRGDDPDFVKVLDFGIARLDWADKSMATQAGLIFGTAKYISPEGAEGQPVGPPADVYSIATILYQMLAGRTPFEGDSPVALLVQHTHAPPLELLRIARASYVPPPIAAVIMQNLAKKPSERAQDARQFGRDLITAARASGLDPEQIAAHSTLFSTGGQVAVKLASRERTRAHELSADLAARIGGIAATPEPSQVAATRGNVLDATPLPSAPRVEDDALPRAPQASGAELDTSAAVEAQASTLRSSSEPHDDDEGRVPNGSTIQGTETTLDAEPTRPISRRARVVRLIAILACVAVATPIAIAGGRHFGASGAAQSESIEASLDEARDCLRRHAWDAPAGHNFKEITDQALARWPGDARIADLRREAAERLVPAALGRKYAGDLPEAIHLIRLALEFNPQLTTAQHLAAELEQGGSPAIAPSEGESPSASASAAMPEPDRPTGSPRKPKAVPSPTSRSPAHPSAHPKAPDPNPKPTGGGAVLPPQPPPLSTDHAPPPVPTATGPWL